MLLSPRKNGPAFFFEEVNVFKEKCPMGLNIALLFIVLFILSCAFRAEAVCSKIGNIGWAGLKGVNQKMRDVYIYIYI